MVVRGFLGVLVLLSRLFLKLALTCREEARAVRLAEGFLQLIGHWLGYRGRMGGDVPQLSLSRGATCVFRYGGPVGQPVENLIVGVSSPLPCWFHHPLGSFLSGHFTERGSQNTRSASDEGLWLSLPVKPEREVLVSVSDARAQGMSRLVQGEDIIPHLSVEVPGHQRARGQIAASGKPYDTHVPLGFGVDLAPFDNNLGWFVGPGPSQDLALPLSFDDSHGLRC